MHFYDPNYIAANSPSQPVIVNGRYRMRLGTYIIKEQTQPEGYLLPTYDSDKTFIVTVEQNSSADGNGTVKTYYDMFGNRLDQTKVEVENEYDVFSVSEQVIRGDIKGSKVLLESGDKELGDINLAGIRFAIVSTSNHSVRVMGTDYNKGQVVQIFNTDENGNFESKNMLLPYGSYTLMELRRDSKVEVGDVYTTADKGSSIYATPYDDSVLWKEQAINFNIVNNAETVVIGNTNNGQDIGNNDSKGQIVIQKTDTENTVKQGDADLSGIKYVIVNMSKYKVKYKGTFYEPNDIVDILTTDNTGKCQTDAKSLDFGTYMVVEAAANTTLKVGNQFDEKNLGDSIYANATQMYLYKAYRTVVIVDRDGIVLEVTNDDPVTRGSIDLTKRDFDSGKQDPQGDGSLVGIKFAIVNRSIEEVIYHVGEETRIIEPGHIIDIMSTDNIGYWTTDAEALPYGTYEVIELRKDNTLAVNDIYDSSSAKYGTSIYASPDDAYLFQANRKTVTIREQEVNETLRAQLWRVDFTDKVSRGDLDITKHDEDYHIYNHAEWPDTDVQGDASFEGIQYAIVNCSNKSVWVDGKDGRGLTEYRPNQTVLILTLDATGNAQTDAKALPYGTYDIIELRQDHTVKVGTAFNESQIGTSIYASPVLDEREGQPSAGYLYTAQTKTIVIREERYHEHFDYYNYVTRAQISVNKREGETGALEAQGVSSFEGIRFAIINRSKKAIYLDNDWLDEVYKVNEVVEIITTDETGYAISSMLPYGTYEIMELRDDATLARHDTVAVDHANYGGKFGTSIYANERGYLYSEDIQNVTLNENKTYDVSTQTDKLRVQDKEYNNIYVDFPVRGDVELHKRNVDGRKVGYIPFLISLLDENGEVVERHVILADKDGHINTQERAKASAGNVFNTLDQYYVDGVYTGPLDDAAASVNIWFGSQNYIMDTRGSLLWGQYLVEELQCENNLDQDMTKQWFNITEEFVVVEPDNYAIDLYLHVESTALDLHSMSEVISVTEDAEVEDTIKIENVHTYNHYELVTELINIKKDGTIVSLGKSEPYVFQPESIDGTETTAIEFKNQFTINTEDAEPGSVVTFVDYLYLVDNDGNRILLTTHNKHLDVEAQTLLVPEVTSLAHNITTGGIRVGSLDPNAVVYDTVAFRNIAQNRFYRMVTEYFFDDGTPVVDVDGNICRTDDLMYVDNKIIGTEWRENPGMYFTNREGTFETAQFELDSRTWEGKTVMIRETLLNEVDGEIVFVHNKKLDVDEQGIRWMHIGTTAMSETRVQGIIPCDEEVKLIDNIAYTNLAEEIDVRIDTKVIDVDTEEVILTKSTNAHLTEEEHSGNIDIEMNLNTLDYAGHRFVVLEWIYMIVDGEDVLVAEHIDTEDEMQIVMIPEIHTTLESEIDGGRYKVIDDRGFITVVDTVTYKNLKIGETYTFEATLMNKLTGEPVLDKDGNEVTGTTTYVPTATEGTVEVEITFEVDGSLISNWENRDEYVAFEEVWSGGLRYAFHKDLEDEDQTVVVPKIRTQALGKDSESKNVISKDGQVVVDTVELKDFVEGDTLTLVIEAHDPETGEYLGFIASKTFVYEGQQFEEIECVIDASELGGKNVVFYEFVHISDKVKKETEIAHEDIPDNFDQTVRIPTGHTSAFDSESELHMSKAREDMRITDIVTYENVEPNREYILKGELIDKETGDVIATAEKKVMLTTKDGEIEIEFVFDGSLLAGKTLVAFETLTELNGVAIFEHKDLEDEEQSVHIPEIKTDAIAKDTEEKVTGAKTETVFVDTVKYKNLIADGREYTMTGYLVDKSNGNPILINGEKITSSVTFIPESPDGEIEMTFTFDSSALAGTTVVVFEDLFTEDVNIGSHADVEDDAQTVYIPKIRTKAFDEDTLVNHSKLGGMITIIDTVKYTSLLPGKEYTVTGKLMDKNTGEPLLIDGKEITGSTTFIPETADGEVEVKFTFDSSKIERTVLVVFEKLFFGEFELASHEDLMDEDQSDYMPEIHTNAIDKATGSHLGRATKEAVIVDTVSYEGLKPNTRYVLTGTLMDKETGKPLLIDGKEITSSVTFVTGDADAGRMDVSGTVDVEFRFDASAIAGKTSVVFESLFYEEREVAVHADIEDEAQTVHFPEVRTNASDKADGDKVLDGTQTTATIVDVVTYKNLVPGLTYKLVAKLMVKETGQPVVDADGKVLTVEVEFVPETSDGTVEVEIEFEASKYAGDRLVVFESLILNDIEIASHEDIEDKDQTVEITLLLDVRIAKADKEKINYYLRGAEITVFNADGTIAKDINGKDCVGLTDENGQIEFVLLYDPDNIYYVQETKAPAGYNINKDKFEVLRTGKDKLGVDLIAINILDEIIIIPPIIHTGDTNNVILYGSLAAVSLVGLIVILLAVKRKNNKKTKANEE